jgi:gamma-glutamyltranspeptidase/glutathione hydrolase|tara:strand:+ start:3473 stop:5164 length:1692 start_codon:yes stop_codon:yes gene_type:complete
MEMIIRMAVFLPLVLSAQLTVAANAPTHANNGMVVSANTLASDIGAEVLRDGGSAMDATVATAFALAVTHPSAGNLGGGGFLIYRSSEGESVAYDFREVAPLASDPEMWLVDGKYSFEKHHMSYQSVGVPGTVRGLHLGWLDQGKLPWKRLVKPAIRLARDGIPVTHGLARSLKRHLPRMEKYPATMAQFSNKGEPLVAGDLLRQSDLARTLQRIANKGPDGFYKGKTAELIVQEMERNGGLITLADLAAYKAKKRVPTSGTYRGYEIISMPPPSSGGTALVEMLNILEGYDLTESGFGTTVTLHRMVEAMRRAFHDRARFMGDPDFNAAMPLAKLTSKEYAEELRSSIDPGTASVSNPESFSLPKEGPSTTHFSVVDKDQNAASLTYTLEWSYGSGIVVTGAGFLLNNEMGDFNAGPGLTDSQGLIGTPANLAEPGKRMLSSMTPTIVAKDGELFMVTGTPGGRTIINTVLQTVVNVIDHGMGAQAAVDAGRVHHQWLPDMMRYEEPGFSKDSLKGLAAMGHKMKTGSYPQGSAEVIVVNGDQGGLDGGVDRRVPDGGVSGY